MLTHVTLSGPDEETEIDSLCSHSASYPFVEWGVLLADLRGEPRARYPRVIGGPWSWFRTLAEEQQRARAAGAGMRLSAHLCGAMSRRFCADEALASDMLSMLAELGFSRVQINGYAEASVDACHDGVLRCIDWALTDNPSMEIVLQSGAATFDRVYADALALCEEAELSITSKPRVSVLFDPSAGRGMPTDWSAIKLPRELEVASAPRVGFAGGLSPTNVAKALVAIEKLMDSRFDYWIDMESGVRNDKDRFDFGKVREVLRIADAHRLTTAFGIDRSA